MERRNGRPAGRPFCLLATVFHVKHDQLEAVMAWAGVSVPSGALERLERYGRWLTDEALRAGGIAPGDREHVWERHVLDSCMFAVHLPTAGTVIDVGTGVGLPGIPLAVVMPHLEFVLIDRSGRRTELIRRVVRILALENVRVVHGDALRHSPADGLVMRAALPPDRLDGAVATLVRAGGYATVGVGVEPSDLPGWELTRFPGTEVLAPGRWIRIMRVQ